MKITLEPKPDSTATAIPYTAKVEILEATVDYNTIFEVPVYVESVKGKTVYNVEICGFRVETSSIDYIPTMVERTVSGLINMARLPSYVFIARRSQGVYPVYTVDNEVFATTPGGPVFRHIELAKVRDFLSDYLHAMDILGVPGKSDKLHVRGVNTTTLALMRPLFYLKKRVPNETEFWAPVFRSRDSRYIYTYAASARREVYEGANEVLALQDWVAKALIQDKRLSNLYDLRPDRLLSGSWQKLKSILIPEGQAIIDDMQLALYQKNGVFLGAEHRADEDRYSLYLGDSVTDVCNRARLDFIRRGIIDPKIAVNIPV